jgi:hypothetical protein
VSETLELEQPVGDLTLPSTAPYDPARDRERIRGRLATIAIGIFGGLVVGIFGAAVLVPADRWQAVRDAGAMLIGSAGTLVGAVTAFYFATEKLESRGGSTSRHKD